MSAQNTPETQKATTSPTTSKKRPVHPAVWFDQITPDDLSGVPEDQVNTFMLLVGNQKRDGKTNIRVSHYENVGTELVEALKTFVRTSRPPPAKKQKKEHSDASSKKDRTAINAKVDELFGEMPTNPTEAQAMNDILLSYEDYVKEGRKRRKLCQNEGWLPKPEPRNRKTSKVSTDGKETNTATDSDASGAGSPTDVLIKVEDIEPVSFTESS